MWGSSYKSLQGNLGLGQAIAFFTSRGIPVSIPLNDTQKYDLVAEIDGILKKISIKTTMHKPRSHYSVLLKNCGGASGKNVSRPFDNTSCDYVFILCKDGTMFCIPSEEIQVKTMLSLDSRFDKYKTEGGAQRWATGLEIPAIGNGEGSTPSPSANGDLV